MRLPEYWIAGSPWHRRYGWGYWNRDLLCVKIIGQNYWFKREKYLSPISNDSIIAFIKFSIEKLLKADVNDQALLPCYSTWNQIL